MNKSILLGNIWEIKKRSAQAYNDYDEYIIQDRTGKLVCGIANDRGTAEKLVRVHNDFIYTILEK